MELAHSYSNLKKVILSPGKCNLLVEISRTTEEENSGIKRFGTRSFDLGSDGIVLVEDPNWEMNPYVQVFKTDKTSPGHPLYFVAVKARCLDEIL